MTPEEKGKPIEGAALIAAKCPSCGAILSVRKGAEVRCEFCGNEFMLRESYGGKSREIRDYYELAYAAQQAGDAYGADRHFAKVLELDGNEALAWYGKGVVALGDSNAREIDAAEAITFFKKALANVDAEEKDGLGRAIRESCFRYADAAFDYLWSSGFPDEDNFRRVLELFNFADEVSPLDNDRLKRVVEVLCTYSSYLVKYSARISLWLFSVIGICGRAAPYRDEVERYTEKIRRTEPAYLNPWETKYATRRALAIAFSIVILCFVVLFLIMFVVLSAGGG